MDNLKEPPIRDYPLLDLKSAWQDAQRCLTEIEEMAQALYDESEHTWADMVAVRYKAQRGRNALGELPQGILDGIAKAEADLDEAEANAPGNVNGY